MLKKSCILLVLFLAGCNEVVEEPEYIPLPEAPFIDYTLFDEQLSPQHGENDYQSEIPISEYRYDALRFKVEYEYWNNVLRDETDEHLFMYVRSDNTVVYLDEYELREFLIEGTGIFFFGNGTCPWCRLAIPPLLDFGYDNNVALYYFNPVADREADTELHRHILEIWHDYLPVNTRDQTYGEADFNPEWKRVTVPHVFFLHRGTVVTHLFLNRHV